MKYEAKQKCAGKKEIAMQMPNIIAANNKRNALHKHELEEAKKASKLYIITSEDKIILYIGFDNDIATQLYLTNIGASYYTTNVHSDAIDKNVRIVKVI